MTTDKPDIDELLENFRNDFNHIADGRILVEPRELANYVQRLLIEAENRGGVRELTRLDNEFDEVTPDRFHQYYLDRIKQLTNKQEGKGHGE